MCFVNTWEAREAARIGAAVKTLRAKRTAQWLADRTTEIGMKMTRQTITDLENGRRRYVTTAELAVLAAALDTAPIALLYPGPYDRQVEVLPGITWPTEIDAAQWFCGLRPGFSEAVGAEQVRVRTEYNNNTRDLQKWRELLDLYKQRSDLRAPDPNKENDVEVYRLLLRNLNTQIDSLRLELRLINMDDLGAEDGG